MPITTFHRGVRFIKDYLVAYLNGIFIASQKGIIQFTDGTRQIDFSRLPEAIRSYSWDFRKIPAVLVGGVSGRFQTMSIAKDLIHAGQVGDAAPLQYYTYGGDISMTVSFTIIANTVDERDNLVDIVCLYLSHPKAKDYLMRHGIAVENPPTIGGESERNEPNIDHPIYLTGLTQPFVSQWRTIEDLPDRLEEIFVDIEAYAEVPSSGRHIL
jgi:hypothetical protein